ncbi:mannose-6-phosphate isomerase [Saccharobesus litoralis]|uniref:Mannose-6-phosphate isomerase n=1 Tax=Saccharobesus litoralis TaxID=2172099 RepID=A0A2S0VP44_9ALTE|nr:AGE family epimerase/isomerase [Saccharobesus litoralis]AWB65986.1 mannose-6-phosphate isomerase [Saccharobesus litoralis]
MTKLTRLQQVSVKFANWLKQESIPLWATKGIDATTGGSHERLTLQGEPDLECNRRVRVNYRQMFVFAMANELGWIDNGQQLVNQLHQFVNRYGANPEQPGTYAHLLGPQGNILDSKQDTYDLAFYLLSCAWRFRAFEDTKAMQEADAMMANLDSYIKGLKGGWLEGDYSADKRRQNPHMHLFEAFMALYDASQQPKWLARAGEIFNMFESHFYDAGARVLLEYFNADWTPQFGTHGKIVEPGHMLEWVWLLREYSDRTSAPVDSYANTLYDNAIAFGKNVTGLIYDETTETGKVIKATKRCWPMTELIKASVAQAKQATDAELKAQYEDNAAEAIEVLMEFYVNNDVKGGYFDQLDADDKVIAEFAPASTLYHLIIAAREALNYCNQTDA